jgi:hypothetical protein
LQRRCCLLQLVKDLDFSIVHYVCIRILHEL